MDLNIDPDLVNHVPHVTIEEEWADVKCPCGAQSERFFGTPDKTSQACILWMLEHRRTTPA